MSECIVRMKMPENCFPCSTKINPEERQCNIDGHIFEETLDKLLYGRDINCPIICQLPEGRSGLVDVWQDVTTLLCALEGKAPEMTDKDAIKVIARAEWLILNQIVRGIDKEGKHEQAGNQSVSGQHT